MMTINILTAESPWKNSENQSAFGKVWGMHIVTLVFWFLQRSYNYMSIVNDLYWRRLNVQCDILIYHVTFAVLQCVTGCDSESIKAQLYTIICNLCAFLTVTVGLVMCSDCSLQGQNQMRLWIWRVFRCRTLLKLNELLQGHACILAGWCTSISVIIKLISS